MARIHKSESVRQKETCAAVMDLPVSSLVLRARTRAIGATREFYRDTFRQERISAATLDNSFYLVLTN